MTIERKKASTREQRQAEWVARHIERLERKADAFWEACEALSEDVGWPGLVELISEEAKRVEAETPPEIETTT